MSDERNDKKGRKGPRGTGGGRDGGGDRPRKPYRPKADAGSAGDRPKKPYHARPEMAGAAERPARSFRPREGGEGSGERPRKPYRPREEGAGPAGDRPKKPYRPREETGGERPARSFRPSDGGNGERPRKPYRPRDEAAGSADAPRKPYRARADAAAGGDRPARSFRPREEGEGGAKPYRPRPSGDRDGGSGGDRPFRKRADGDRPREARPQGEGSSGFRPGRRERAEGAGAGERTSFRPREDRPRDGDRPFRKRPEGAADRKGGFDKPRPRQRDEAAPEEGERIAKRLARAGISSRRDAEEMIAAGRVKVNGKVLASPAVNVGPDDVIHVDNELIPAIERTRLFLFHKPGGVVTTNRDPEGRRTVFDVLPDGLPRLVTVGRLDINTEGLLLLTNDGGLARLLELPSTGWLRRYRARVHGRVDEKALAGLKDGIAVDGVFYGSIEASLDREQGTNAWLTIGLREGKYREVKNVLGALGLDVSRLIRISFGPFQLGELAEGAVQELKGKALRDQLGERMIAESGANFEAPIVNEFSNRPVVRSRDAEEEAKPVRRQRAEPGEGGLIKSRKRQREEHREDVLGRLDTRPERGGFERKDGPRDGAKPFGKPGGKPRDKTEKPFEPPKTRSANVWMAPGARPQGKKTEPEAGSGEKGRFRSPSSRPTGRGKPRKGS